MLASPLERRPSHISNHATARRGAAVVQALSSLALSRYLILTRRLIRIRRSWELSQMDGGQIGGIPLDAPTLIRLVVVLVLAIVVRHLVLRYGTKAINKRRDKDRAGKPRH